MTCKMLLRVLSVHPLTLKMSARFVSTCEIRLATPKVSTPSAPDITQSTVNGGGQTPPTSTGNLERAPALVSVQWLYEKLEANTPNLRILDCSWHLPFARRDAKTEYHRGHIPGSSFFDIDECSDKESPYEHTLPKAEIFENYVGKMGINNQSHVVVYDNNANFGMFSAQRVWWTFRVFGHHNVSILNGGLPKWQNSGYWDTDEATKMPIATFKASFNPALVKYFEDVERNLSSKEFQLIDARPVGRFDGSSPEPRPGIKPGHVKGGVNMPFNSIMNLQEKMVKEPEQLRQAFAERGIDLEQPTVAMCGSGVSGCGLALAAYLCGKEDVAVYDGSWTEWYSRARPDQTENVNKTFY